MTLRGERKRYCLGNNQMREGGAPKCLIVRGKAYLNGAVKSGNRKFVPSGFQDSVYVVLQKCGVSLGLFWTANSYCSD